MTKLNRTETVTARLDPKLNYLCELASRAQRRTKSSFIEWAIQEALKECDYGFCPCCGADTSAPRNVAEAGNPAFASFESEVFRQG